MPEGREDAKMTEPIQGEIGKRASAASAELEDSWQEYAVEWAPEDKDIEIHEFEADLADFDESMVTMRSWKGRS